MEYIELKKQFRDRYLRGRELFVIGDGNIIIEVIAEYIIH